MVCLNNCWHKMTTSTPTDDAEYTLVMLDEGLRDIINDGISMDQLIVLAKLKGNRLVHQTGAISLHITVSMFGRSVHDMVLIKHDSQGYRRVDMPDGNTSLLRERMLET